MQGPGIQRAVIFCALLLSVFLLPWWGTLAIAALYIGLFDAMEGIFAGVLLDALYGAPVASMQGWPVLCTFMLLLVYCVVHEVKPRLLLRD